MTSNSRIDCCYVLQAMPHPMQSSIQNLLPIACQSEPSNEVSIQPFTLNIGDSPTLVMSIVVS